jgi:hypothetical protein
MSASGKPFVREWAFDGRSGEEGGTAMRSLSSLTIIMLATVTLGAAGGYAQTTPPSNCGVETWSTDKMTYVTVPCAGGQEETGQTAKAPGTTNCGVETWSTEKMAYVGTPCPHRLTYENPSSPSTSNPLK